MLNRRQGRTATVAGRGAALRSPSRLGAAPPARGDACYTQSPRVVPAFAWQREGGGFGADLTTSGALLQRGLLEADTKGQLE